MRKLIMKYLLGKDKILFACSQFKTIEARAKYLKFSFNINSGGANEIIGNGVEFFLADECHL